MRFLGPLRPTKSQKPTSFSLVDIGRDTVKAVVILVIPDNVEPQVIGHGIAETGGHDIAGGRLEADAVTAPVNEALIQAEDSTEGYIGQKIVPDDVIIALAGRATAGKLYSVRQNRPKPAEPTTGKELENLKMRAERLARQGLANLPVEGGHWQPLAVTDAGLYLDGRLVMGGVGLTGRELSFSLYGVAGQAGALRALEVLANRLDLMIANIVAAPQALAATAPYPEAIILDTGYTGTDVYLIRDNALVGAGWVPFGGSFFTQALAQAMDVDPEEARQLKHAINGGELAPMTMERVNVYLDQPRERWYGAIMEALHQLSVQADSQGEMFDRPLPRKIYFVGCGNLLPGLEKLLTSDPTPFDGIPEVARLGPRALPALKDLTGSLDYDRYALALSLMVGLPE